MTRPASAPRGFEAAESWWLRVLEPGFGRTSGGLDLTCSPDGDLVAFTGTSVSALEGTPTKSVCLLDLANRQVRRIAEGGGHSLCPSWAPGGGRLAFLSDRDLSGAFHPYVVELSDPDNPTSFPMTGLTAESIEWLRDGDHVVVLAAEAGAEQPAVTGAGASVGLGGRGTGESWQPSVRRSGKHPEGWRRLFCVRLVDGDVSPISGESINVWEACVAGDAVLAVASNLPTEGDWFNSSLVLLALDGVTIRKIYEPRWQLAWPAASADGSRLAVVEGIASDRGVVAGDILLFERDGEGARKLDSAGVDVTWLQFRDNEHLCYGGVRDADTVFGEIEISTGRVIPNIAGSLTTSGTYPSAAAVCSGGLLLLGEHWDHPPFLARALAGQVEELASLSQPGYEWLRSRLGPMTQVSWLSSDGEKISGLLTAPPARSAPHPTILLVHGGPAHLWTAAWPGKTGMLMVAAYLVSRGFAIFLPNPRGSSGRGQRYLELELGDYGGTEVDDDLLGIDLLIREGITDAERLGVMGASHGGYMTCRLTTKTNRFKAGVAISPYTDFYSQHFGGNVPGFDVQYLRADLNQPGGPYFHRSPLFEAAASVTPTLLTAGARDQCTPAGQAVEFHHALAAAGVETELAIYPDEGHGVRSLPAEIDLAARAADFLERHVLGDQPKGSES
jgi:dipeptidyl aminopeptidase/acylaminoacyl peptidase